MTRQELQALRDEFAMAALEGLLANEGYESAGEIAMRSYSIAEAMLTERLKQERLANGQN